MDIATRVKRIDFNKLVNFVLFQGIWLACILGAANNKMLSAWILFGTLIYWQSCPKNRSHKDFIFVLTLLPLGLLIDSLWVYLQLIEYKELIPFNMAAPYWIGILWITFALSLNSSMSWLFEHPKIAIIFGALGGPLSYLAAERLGAITIFDKNITLLLLGLSWLLVMLVILAVNSKLKTKKMGLKHA